MYFQPTQPYSGFPYFQLLQPGWMRFPQLPPAPDSLPVPALLPAPDSLPVPALLPEPGSLPEPALLQEPGFPPEPDILPEKLPYPAILPAQQRRLLSAVFPCLLLIQPQILHLRRSKPRRTQRRLYRLPSRLCLLYFSYGFLYSYSLLHCSFFLFISIFFFKLYRSFPHCLPVMSLPLLTYLPLSLTCHIFSPLFCQNLIQQLNQFDPAVKYYFQVFILPHQFPLPRMMLLE